MGGIFTRGPGFSLVEATAVRPEGRITPDDAGIWNDEQAAAWGEIVTFAHSQGQKIGIQLAHGGRKSSTVAYWLSWGAVADPSVGGWPGDVWGPSDVPYDDVLNKPKALSVPAIKEVVDVIMAAA